MPTLTIFTIQPMYCIITNHRFDYNGDYFAIDRHSRPTYLIKAIRWYTTLRGAKIACGRLKSQYLSADPERIFIPGEPYRVARIVTKAYHEFISNILFEVVE